MADFNYTGGVRFAPDIVVDVTADKDGNPTKACNPITGICLKGGGGDSDFSTANVTLKFVNADTLAGFCLPVVIDNGTSIGYPTDKTLVVTPMQYVEQTIKMPVYENLIIFGTVFMSGGTIENLQVSGDAELGPGAAIITGDCEITVTYQEIT